MHWIIWVFLTSTLLSIPLVVYDQWKYNKWMKKADLAYTKFNPKKFEKWLKHNPEPESIFLTKDDVIKYFEKTNRRKRS